MFYKIELKSMPQFCFSFVYTSEKFCHNFPVYQNLLEITLLEEGVAYKSNVQPLSAPNINYIFHDFVGSVSSDTHHKHTTVGIAADYTYQAIEIQTVTRTDLEVWEQNPNIILLPSKLTDEKQYANIRQLLRQIVHQRFMRRTDFQLNALSTWFSLVSYLTKICIEQILGSEQFGVTPSKMLYAERACRYIHQNIMHPIKTEEIADHLNISVNHLQSVFKAVMHTTIIEYINVCRIERAKECFVRQKISTKEVAAELGFQDIGYFSRLFKKVTGMTVTEYKNTLS